MAIRTACPSCGKVIDVPDHFAGRSGKCKACTTGFVIPHGAFASSPIEADTIAVACHCGNRFRVASTYAGRQSRCPACKAIVFVADPKSAEPHPMADVIDTSLWSTESKSPAPAATTVAAPTRDCPYCGESVLAVARKCKHCGEYLDEELRASKIAVSGPGPNIVVQANKPITPMSTSDP